MRSDASSCSPRSRLRTSRPSRGARGSVRSHRRRQRTPSTRSSQRSDASRVEVPSTTQDLPTKTKRFSTLHSGDKVGTTGWRWTRSPASSPSSPLASNCLRGEIGEPAKAKPPQQSKKAKKDPKDQDEDSDSD